jgi:hypothetical protein
LTGEKPPPRSAAAAQIEEADTCQRGPRWRLARTFARLAAVLGVLELARAVGHRDLRMLQMYYNESAEDIAKKLK